ncbi:MAG TPA: HK97 family phage prohead protease [Actinomycetota bacterium]|nr:HK97 family phage prohead protease [Actinomycetota bacterium]
MADLEIRSAELTSVRFADRVIELVVVPWESDAMVPHEGRMIRERFTRGAFAGLERRANRIRVNRDHQAERTVGRALTFHDRDEGLVAEVRIAQTALGEETLELANEGALDASAGFLPMPGGESWHERRTMRRITKAWLGHIALTPDPAYLDARVLAVRTAEPVQVGTAERIATPLLDEVRSWRLREQFGSLTTE